MDIPGLDVLRSKNYTEKIIKSINKVVKRSIAKLNSCMFVELMNIQFLNMG